jgi:hypothetical protein
MDGLKRSIVSAAKMPEAENSRIFHLCRKSVK